jgi:hypothetical protein
LVRISWGGTSKVTVLRSTFVYVSIHGKLVDKDYFLTIAVYLKYLYGKKNTQKIFQALLLHLLKCDQGEKLQL